MGIKINFRTRGLSHSWEDTSAPLYRIFRPLCGPYAYSRDALGYLPCTTTYKWILEIRSYETQFQFRSFETLPYERSL